MKYIYFQALADIKPDVEATIKMGRKLVEAGAVSDSVATTKNIDQLKELFNTLGAQVKLKSRTLTCCIYSLHE